MAHQGLLLGISTSGPPCLLSTLWNDRGCGGRDGPGKQREGQLAQAAEPVARAHLEGSVYGTSSRLAVSNCTSQGNGNAADIT